MKDTYQRIYLLMFVITLICGFFYNFFGKYGIYIEYAGPVFPVLSFFIYGYNMFTKKTALEEPLKAEETRPSVYCITENHEKLKKPCKDYDDDDASKDSIDKELEDYPYWSYMSDKGDNRVH